MPRPLLQKTITELEQFFENWRSSPEQLRILKAELLHRTRPKAKKLLQRVETILNGRPVAAGVQESETQTTLWTDVSADEVTDGSAESTSRSRYSSTNEQEYFASPDEFCLVQPVGVRPRPNAYHPVLREDLRLPVSPDDRPITLFRVAIAELIREMKQLRKGHQQFALEDGDRIPTEVGGCSYQFAFDEEANLFEGARVELIIGGNVVTSNLTAILPGRIIITLQDDFGDRIHSCVLRIDNTALLQALHDRLQNIEQGETVGFRLDVAESLLTNTGATRPGMPIAKWPWPQHPTKKQKAFVELAIANDISWLWGPPGTGKTDTLSALIRILYEAGKRILICSNTNRAVDQLLHKLCRRMRETNDEALDAGRVIRLGRIEDELRKEFGDYITPDRIVERKSQELIRRKNDIEAELERLGREVSHTHRILKQFTALHEARGTASTIAKAVTNATNELARNEDRITAAQRVLAQFDEEKTRRQQAGTLRRLFMRDEATIRQDIRNQESAIQSLKQSTRSLEEKVSTARQSLQDAIRTVAALERELAHEDKSFHDRVLAQYGSKQTVLRTELSAIATKLEDIRNSVLHEARIVGATVTRTFLRPAEFALFDTVIVDEASMILLPAVFHAAGLATEKLVIAGDFLQLPPIVQTEQRCIHEILSPDIFHRAGITIDTVSTAERLMMLDEQFRMDDSICRIVSLTFYAGALHTHPEYSPEPFSEPAPFSQRMVIVDTSRVWPFTTRNVFESRLNLMHALAIRNLVLHFRAQARLFDADNRCRLGICTPYAAQAKLFRDVFKSHELDPATMRASTVHGFQGDERPVMILDLVDSVGERNAGIFLQSNQLCDSGAKLMNVALSRAKCALIIVGNLTYLDQKLPSDAILRGLLHDIQRLGQIVDVRDVLALYPILDDLKTFDGHGTLDAESLRTGLFRSNDFDKLCHFDMENATHSIVVFSAFITPQRAARVGDVLRRKIAEGVKVRCVTRPPNRNGSIAEELGTSALRALEGVGAKIDLRSDIHEKVVLIDSRICWFGSLNPLSHNSKTTELMARVDDPGFASHIASMLTLRRRPKDEFEKGAAAEPENPRCEQCGGWSVLIRGRYGPFFACAHGDDWKMNLDAVRRNRNQSN